MNLRVCKTQSRQLTLRGALDGKIRYAKYRSVEHLVVPVVAMVEGVVWPVNAPYPELVRAAELERYPEGWNGRPCVVNHPFRNGDYVSANYPSVLEEEKFGEIFGSRYTKKRLGVEAWLSPELAEKVGERAVIVLDRILKHEDVEISIGAFLDLLDVEGEWLGKKYNGEWQNLVPDHLAFLSKGSKGACSVEMGCGAPRTARLHVLNSNFDSITIEETPMAAETGGTEQPTPAPTKQSWLSRMKSVFSKGEEEKTRIIHFVGATSFEMADSDSALRSELSRELRATVPGYMSIEGVNAKEGVVLFSAMPRDSWEYFTHEFTSRAGTVKLKGEPTKVEPVTRFEPVAASASPNSDASAPCGCGSKEPLAMDKKARIAALIANPKTGFTAAHQSILESFTDEQLTAAEKVEVPVATPATSAPAAAVAAPPAPVASATQLVQHPAPAAAAAAPAAETEEQALARFPRIRDLVNRQEAAEKARRTFLVSKLVTAQKTYTEKELTDMPIDQLEKVGSLMNVEQPVVNVDRSLLGPSGPQGNDEEVPEAPSLMAAMAKDAQDKAS